MSDKPLSGRTIAVPETRELDLFAQMLESRGAYTVRCPLVTILDAPDRAPIDAWLNQLAAGHFHDVILLTGEGLRRLLSAAEQTGMVEAVIAALASTRKITRGPKPGRALRDIGLRSDLTAPMPTSDGVIAALSQLKLNGRRIGVQLYGAEPNLKLINSIRDNGGEAFPVAPYIYADKAADQKVISLIDQLAEGGIDVIAFTSAQQVTRLCTIAEANGLTQTLAKGWTRTKIAAVGPIVADTLQNLGIGIDMMPKESYFMKPLVNSIIAEFSV